MRMDWRRRRRRAGRIFNHFFVCMTGDGCGGAAATAATAGSGGAAAADNSDTAPRPNGIGG